VVRPELLRYKAIWRDVLLASLAIQLMALATPIFTQIVIDKVIVHHTLSTLAVIGVALGIFIVFTAVMSWVRQYLVLHTGNRIERCSGRGSSSICSNCRRATSSTGRPACWSRGVHGVETIREFLSERRGDAGPRRAVPPDLPGDHVLLQRDAHLDHGGRAARDRPSELAVTPLLRQRLNQQFLLGARNQAFLTEYVSGMETVKSLQLEPQLQRRFGDLLATYLQAGFATRQLSNTYNVAAGALEQLLTLAILCVGAWMVMTTQEFTIGMLVAFQMFAGRLSQPCCTWSDCGSSSSRRISRSNGWGTS
jgi:subfamily B ATP-binding cassette protein HlyB/CyaB